MDEYIERDAVHDLVRSLTKYAWAFPVRNERRVTVDVDDVQFGVDKIPSADVAPVRHGRWVDKPLIKSFKHTNIPVVECSACGIDFCDIINNHYFMYKYCPNCGAKMDGGSD